MFYDRRARDHAGAAQAAQAKAMSDSTEQAARAGGLSRLAKALRASAGRGVALLRARRRLAFAIAGAVLLLALLWMGARPPQVESAVVRTQTVEIALSVVGRVRPVDLVDIRSPNSGQVIRLYHDEGDVVDAGAALAAVRAQVEQAQTEALRARERAARAEAERARRAYDRTQTLAERGFASPAAVDDARATLRSADAAVDVAAAERAAAASRTREFTIRAPMAGVLLARPIDNGQVISTETTLFQLGSRDGLEIEAEVDEAYADGLRVGMAARAALSGSDTQFAAQIIEVSPRVDPSTGGRLVRLAPTAEMSIPPGRSVDVTIVVARRADSIVIPRQALIDAAAAPQVYVVDPRGVVTARNVRVLDWPSLNAIVEEGLAAGERVALSPTQTRPGARVRIVERAAAEER